MLAVLLADVDGERESGAAVHADFFHEVEAEIADLPFGEFKGSLLFFRRQDGYEYAGEFLVVGEVGAGHCDEGLADSKLARQVFGRDLAYVFCQCDCVSESSLDLIMPIYECTRMTL